MHLNTDDVIAVPGQNLTRLQCDILAAMANGNNQAAILQATQLDAAGLRMAELEIRDKLGAKTPGHMVARGFVLGVLLPRALCVMLATCCALANDHNSNRNRSPLRSRVPETLTRLARSATSNSRSGRAANAGHVISAHHSISYAFAGQLVHAA
ncbi:hypothetical protein [Pseudomonas sp. NMI795_08]|uniref:hypothetical protein n=1 Tax=Pseudomonas sp. NMI795_08 TaxID=2903144 RepID=UPI001E2C6E60|nr:hypothetical protein [Pseudomonas sp. NMI795_08]MCE1119095.1 hypothetical protein [Pseudomonas sp. NMI795_08]